MEMGCVFNLVSVLHNELEYKVEKLKYKKLCSCRSRSRGSKTNPNFQMVNKPYWISPNEVLQFWLIKTAYHLLVNNNRGDGRGAY